MSTQRIEKRRLQLERLNSQKFTDGYDPIHQASALNLHSRVQRLLTINPSRLEECTRNTANLTPLLIAATCGSQDVVHLLLKSGADVAAKSEEGLSVVQCAVSHGHTQLALSLVSHPDVDNLQELLSYVAFLPPTKGLYRALRVLNAIVSIHMLEKQPSAQSNTWQSKFIAASGIQRLSVLLGHVGYDSRRSLLATLTINIITKLTRTTSVSAEIRKSPIPGQLVSLAERETRLEVCMAIVEALTAIVRSSSTGCQLVKALGAPGVIIGIVKRFKDLRIRRFAMCCITSCLKKQETTQYLYSSGLLPEIVRLLEDDTIVDSTLVISIVDTLEAMAKTSEKIRDSMVALGTVHLIIKRLEIRQLKVATHVIRLLKALCYTQKGETEAIIKQSSKAINILISLARHSINPVSQYKAFEILWLTAGESDVERRALVSLVGPTPLLDVIGLAREDLQLLVTTAIRLISSPLYGLQDEIGSAGGVTVLIKSIRVTNTEIQFQALLALEHLSCQLAMRPNTLIQQQLMDTDGGIQLLLQLYNQSRHPKVRLQAICAAAAFTVANQKLKKAIMENSSFSLLELIDSLNLIRDEDQLDRLHTLAKAVCYLAYNSLETQFTILQTQRLSIRPFLTLLSSKDMHTSTEAAFQAIVLSRVCDSTNQTDSLANNILHLVQQLEAALDRRDIDTQVHIASLLSALFHTRAGISDAFISIATVPLLTKMLLSPYEHCRRTSAIALSYLTANPAGVRAVLRSCRKKPTTFRILKKYSSGYTLAPEFLAGWKHHRKTCHLER